MSSSSARPHSLTAHITRYLDSRRSQGRYSDASILTVRSRLGSFAAHYGQTPVAVMHWRHVEGWMESLAGKKPATRASYLAALKQFCRWLVRHEIVTVDPCSDIEPVKQPRKLPKGQPQSAVRSARDACQTQREKITWWLMYGCGLRRAEVAGARWEDYDPDTGLLHVFYGKGGHQRELPVPPQLAEVLEAEPVHSGPLVKRTDGWGDQDVNLSPARIGVIGRQINERAGLRSRGRMVTNHAWRHTAASEMADADPDLRTTQEFLGHALLATTQVYVGRVGLRKVRAAMDLRPIPVEAAVSVLDAHRRRWPERDAA